MKGRLYLMPAPLDLGCDPAVPLHDILPQANLALAAKLQYWICENAKSCRSFLKRVGETQALAQPLQQIHIFEMPREMHKRSAAAAGIDPSPWLAPALQGHDIGLISEAGMPAIADPGELVVRCAHALGLTVVPLVGPASMLLALAASGLNGQNFAFVGYIPQDSAERAARIKALESLALRTGQTQIFIETPYRNPALVQALLANLQDSTRLCIASGLTLAASSIRVDTAKTWREGQIITDLRLPAIFSLGR